MSYFVKIKKSAEKDFKKLPEQIKQRVSSAILALEENPNPPSSKKLKNRDEYRIRVGDYRILYFIDNEKKEVEIVIVDHRKDVYR